MPRSFRRRVISLRWRGPPEVLGPSSAIAHSSAAEESAWDGVVQRGHQANLQLEDRPIKGGLFLVLQVGKTFQQANPDVRIVLDKGRYLVADLTSCELKRLVHHDEICWQVRPLPANVAVVKAREGVARAPVPWVQALVSSISEPELRRVSDVARSPLHAALAERRLPGRCKLGAR